MFNPPVFVSEVPCSDIVFEWQPSDIFECLLKGDAQVLGMMQQHAVKEPLDIIAAFIGCKNVPGNALSGTLGHAHQSIELMNAKLLDRFLTNLADGSYLENDIPSPVAPFSHFCIGATLHSWMGFLRLANQSWQFLHHGHDLWDELSNARGASSSSSSSMPSVKV